MRPGHRGAYLKFSTVPTVWWKSTAHVIQLPKQLGIFICCCCCLIAGDVVGTLGRALLMVFVYDFGSFQSFFIFTFLSGSPLMSTILFDCHFLI